MELEAQAATPKRVTGTLRMRYAVRGAARCNSDGSELEPVIDFRFAKLAKSLLPVPPLVIADRPVRWGQTGQ